MERMRRLRVSPAMRSMVRENHVRIDELVYPVFVMEGQDLCQPVDSMPGICQYSIDRLPEELNRVTKAGIPAVLLFGIPAHKDEVGSGAYDDQGIVQQAVRFIKSEKKYQNLIVIADVCLCEYTSHGHCGLVKDGIILNDETLPLLAKTAVSYAKAGADIIAPSDMMDSRVRAIREALDENGFVQRQIRIRILLTFPGCGPFRSGLWRPKDLPDGSGKRPGGHAGGGGRPARRGGHDHCQTCYGLYGYHPGYYHNIQYSGGGLQCERRIFYGKSGGRKRLDQ